MWGKRLNLGFGDFGCSVSGSVSEGGPCTIRTQRVPQFGSVGILRGSHSVHTFSMLSRPCLKSHRGAMEPGARSSVDKTGRNGAGRKAGKEARYDQGQTWLKGRTGERATF